MSLGCRIIEAKSLFQNLVDGGEKEFILSLLFVLCQGGGSHGQTADKGLDSSNPANE